MTEGRSSAVPAWIRTKHLEGLPLARATQVALAVTVVLFVFGSSSVSELHRIGSPLRWVGLVAFTAISVLWAAAERAEPSRLVAVALPTGALAALGVASAAWSVEPHLTVERAGSFIVALVGAAAVGATIRGRADAAVLVAEAVVGATALVCIGGGVLYAFDPALAAQLPLPNTPLRFQGLGENPNTVQMIAAVAAIPAAWLAVSSHGLRRALAAGAVVVTCAQIAASGSRGGLLAIAAGGACFALAAPDRRTRLKLLAATVAVTGAVVAGDQLLLVTIPSPTAAANQSAPRPTIPGTGVARPAKYPQAVLPTLDSELGTTPSGNRALFGGQGRGAALREALHQGNARPIAGFGFGTEEHVFFDRLEEFQSARPENSFLGLYLQLGVLGPLLWALVGLAVVWLAIRARRFEHERRRAVGAMCGAVLAGYALGLGQSYVYAVGNVATLGFWIAAFVVAGLVGSPHAWPPARRLAIVGVIVIGRWEGSRDRARQNAGIERIWNLVGGLQGREADGFRLAPPLECVLYGSGNELAAYELCFQDGHVLEAYDRLHGGFQVWSLRPFGPYASVDSVSAAAVDARIHALDPHANALQLGDAYATRPVPR